MHAEILKSGLTSHAYLGDVGMNLNFPRRLLHSELQQWMVVPLLCSLKSRCFVIGWCVTLGYEEVCSSWKVLLDVLTVFYGRKQEAVSFVPAGLFSHCIFWHQSTFSSKTLLGTAVHCSKVMTQEEKSSWKALCTFVHFFSFALLVPLLILWLNDVWFCFIYINVSCTMFLQNKNTVAVYCKLHLHN